MAPTQFHICALASRGTKIDDVLTIGKELNMQGAYFVVRTGMMAGPLMTVHGPFENEAAAIAAAAGFQPGQYTIYGGAMPGKTFSIAAPIITFDVQ
jgi:hypothetical protein